MPAELRPTAVRGLVEGLAARMRWPRASAPTVSLEIPGPVLAQARRLRKVIRPDRPYRFESADGWSAVTVCGHELAQTQHSCHEPQSN
jgi:hypothetical protein